MSAATAEAVKAAMGQLGAEVEYRALLPGHELAVVSRIIAVADRPRPVFALYVGEARGKRYLTLAGACRATERWYRDMGARSAYWRVRSVQRALVANGEVAL